MNMQQLREFVSLENRKKDLDAELKAVKQQLDELEDALIPQFIEDGVQRMTVDGRTVSIQQDMYASPLNDRDEVVDALKQSELGQYVAENYNSNSLTAFVREVKREVELRAHEREPDVQRGRRAGRTARTAGPRPQDLVRSQTQQPQSLRRNQMSQELVKHGRAPRAHTAPRRKRWRCRRRSPSISPAAASRSSICPGSR